MERINRYQMLLSFILLLPLDYRKIKPILKIHRVDSSIHLKIKISYLISACGVLPKKNKGERTMDAF